MGTVTPIDHSQKCEQIFRRLNEVLNMTFGPLNKKSVEVRINPAIAEQAGRGRRALGPYFIIDVSIPIGKAEAVVRGGQTFTVDLFPAEDLLTEALARIRKSVEDLNKDLDVLEERLKAREAGK